MYDAPVSSDCTISPSDAVSSLDVMTSTRHMLCMQLHLQVAYFQPFIASKVLTGAN